MDANSPKPFKPRKRVLTLNPKSDDSPIADQLPEDENEWLRVVDNFRVEMRNQYGMWEIKPLKGKTPAVLQGQYTSAEKARQAIENYINT